MRPSAELSILANKYERLENIQINDIAPKMEAIIEPIFQELTMLEFKHFLAVLPDSIVKFDYTSKNNRRK